jgi:hypothetical protein
VRLRTQRVTIGPLRLYRRSGFFVLSHNRGNEKAALGGRLFMKYRQSLSFSARQTIHRGNHLVFIPGSEMMKGGDIAPLESLLFWDRNMPQAKRRLRLPLRAHAAAGATQPAATRRNTGRRVASSKVT